MIKRIVINIGLFVLVLFLLDFGVGKIVEHLYYNQKGGVSHKTTYSIQETEAKILAFGSSRAFHHFVPTIFEDSFQMTFYNTGRDGPGGVFYQYALLEKIEERYSPEILLLEAGGTYFSPLGNRNLAILGPYYRKGKVFKEIVDLKDPYEKVRMLSKVYPYNSIVFDMIFGNISNHNTDTLRGYEPLSRVWNQEIDTVSFGDEFEFDSLRVAYFERLVRLAKSSQSKAYFIYAPLYRIFKNNPDIDTCRVICEKYDIPFLDYSQHPLFLENRHYFQDIAHLNHEGAIVFSKMIVEDIKKEME